MSMLINHSSRCGRVGGNGTAQTDRIYTTHVGALPRPDSTDRWNTPDDDVMQAAVTDVIARERAAGVDIINEGEYTKGSDWPGASKPLF